MIKEASGMAKHKNSASSKTDGLLNWSDFKTVKGKTIYAIMLILLILLSLVCLLPVIWIFLSSIKTAEEMLKIPPTIFPHSFNVSQIGRVWKMANIGKYFKNSVFIIVGCWAFDVFFNGLAGYVLSRLKPKGSAFISTLIFWTMMMPGMSIVPLYMTYIDLPIFHINLLGTFWPIWLAVTTNAFNIFLFRNFFNGIPMDYIEAARIDGCGEMKTFFSIILPLAKPVVMCVTIFSVIGSWSNFFWPYIILGSTQKEPISVLIFKLTTAGSPFKVNEQMTIMMISIVPPIIMYAFLSKQIMGGMNMSGIKG